MRSSQRSRGSMISSGRGVGLPGAGACARGCQLAESVRTRESIAWLSPDAAFARRMAFARLDRHLRDTRLRRALTANAEQWREAVAWRLLKLQDRSAPAAASVRHRAVPRAIRAAALGGAPASSASARRCASARVRADRDLQSPRTADRTGAPLGAGTDLRAPRNHHRRRRLHGRHGAGGRAARRSADHVRQPDARAAARAFVSPMARRGRRAGQRGAAPRPRTVDRVAGR